MTTPSLDSDTPAGPGGRPRSRPRRVLRRLAVAGAVLFVLMQAVPYGWRHDNPPVTAAAPWPSEQAEALARDSCYACHSNETDWPPYSYVAPFSWLVRQDVDEGRDELNFSEWDRDSDADDAAETVADQSMPPDRYTLAHPDARLSAEDRRVLVAALEAMDRAGDDDD